VREWSRDLLELEAAARATVKRSSAFISPDASVGGGGQLSASRRHAAETGWVALRSKITGATRLYRPVQNDEQFNGTLSE
jgi:hypothetical protein